MFHETKNKKILRGKIATCRSGIKNFKRVEQKMTQNKVKVTWKAIVAIMLVMATIIAMSALVSAEFMESFLGEEIELMAATSSGPSGHTHSYYNNGTGDTNCQKDTSHGMLTKQVCKVSGCGAERTICTSCPIPPS